MNRGPHRIRVVRRWHRRTGAAAALFFLLLAVSGVLLNHPDATGLNARKVHSAMLARWYGFTPHRPQRMYRSGAHVLAWGNGIWLLDARVIAEDAASPVGMVEVGPVLYVGTADTLFAYGPDYALIEKMPSAALPAVPIRALGTKDDLLQLRTGAGAFASVDGVRWQPATEQRVTWSVAQPVPPLMQSRLAPRLLPGISLQQLIADVHSGRILGKYGGLIVDVLGLSLIILALSGAWLFLFPHRRRPPPPRAQ